MIVEPLYNLALLYGDWSRYADAMPLFERSLAILGKTLGPGHSEVATSLNNLAAVYAAHGRYADLPSRCTSGRWQYREKLLGPENSEVATSLNNLAELHRYRGRYADAEPLYVRSLGILEKTLWC